MTLYKHLISPIFKYADIIGRGGDDVIKFMEGDFKSLKFPSAIYLREKQIAYNN